MEEQKDFTLSVKYSELNKYLAENMSIYSEPFKVAIFRILNELLVKQDEADEERKSGKPSKS